MNCNRLNFDFVRAFRHFVRACSLLFVFGVMEMATASAQALPSPPTPPQADSKNTQSDAAASTNSEETSASNPNQALSSSQLLGILQRSPELVIELKNVLADSMTQQGVPTQPDSISDEVLYQQLSTNADFRAGVTAFLRARGYLSTSDTPTEQTQSSMVGNEVLVRDGTRSSGDGSLLQSDRLSTSDFGFAKEEVAGLQGGNPAASEQQVVRPERYGSKRAETKSPQVADEPQVLHRPAPYNLLSLRDQYTQITVSSQSLKRFGSDVFTSRGGTVAQGSPLDPKSSPLDVPIGPDYVVGPGDTLTINLWGGLTQTLNRTIDREGRVMLPESGEVQVAGLTLERAQALISEALRQQFRNAQVAVTIGRLRTIRIYVVGDVQRPGAYDISSLSSPLGALYAAGGPTAAGSLRVLRHMRNDKVIGQIDLYDFLLHGVRSGDDRLEGGDSLVVPPAGPQVTVYGAVKRPAIYELLHESNLAALLDEAGGTTVAAALQNITIERIDANHQRETVTVPSGLADNLNAQKEALASFPLRDGDRISVAPILPQSESVIYLEGHVARPGRIAYREGMHLNDVLRSYRDLLPEPADQGELVRLVRPDLHVETLDFNVPDALIGNANPPLQPFDTIRIFGRYEQDSPDVFVRGEVLRPGSYAMSNGMTAAQLVRMAGGFKRDALLDSADLISYQVENGSKIVTERRDLRIGDAVLREDQTSDVRLKAGDVLTVHQITGWEDIGASIFVEGEVAHPGSYGFQPGEHLSDVLRRAGGFRDTAYPEGAVLTRPEVRALEEKSREELIRQIETSTAAARLAPNLGSGDQAGTLQAIQQQQDQVLSRLRSQPASGRLVIHVGPDIAAWAGTAADVEVRSGDILRVPKKPGFVLITGQVYNASAISFVPNKSAGWYLQHAGGATGIANRKEIFVIRANGSVVGRRSGDWYDRDVLSTKLNPGDVIVVPQKVVGASLFWRNLLSTAQIASSIAITAAVAGL